ncbi:MAG: zinc ribbon domain-containing protein [Clostridiales bacterium]|nr:zinc ribbon domain-containing protein [Clostridiales bacterium]
MFFIMGISQGRKKLDFDQLIVCGRCGRYGRIEVYMVYTYLSLFFIPVFKWGRRYFVHTTCCNTDVEISAELGRQIARGEVTSLPEDIIPQSFQPYSDNHSCDETPQRKRCPSCGFETDEDYQFCPKCGQRL